MLDTVGAGALSYTDTMTTASTTYRYTVDAFDTAGLHSAQSSPAASITTRGGDVTTTFADIADTYASSASPTTKFGTSTSIKVDGDGIFQSYLRFAVQPTGGQVISATLRIFPTSSHSVGYDVYGVSDDTWSESTLTWNTKPPMAGTMAGSSGKVTASTWTTVDVTSLVSDALLNNGGHVNLGLQTTSTTALSMSSRETTNAPELVDRQHAGDGGGDTTPPAKPGGVGAAQGSNGAVTVSWNGNTEPDLAGYTVYRGGTALGTVAAGTLSYSDTTTAPSTTYSYTVDAFDTAGNHSSVSDPASVTTRGTVTGQTQTLAPTADSYVLSTSPTTNYGTATTVRVDGDGIAMTLSPLRGSRHRRERHLGEASGVREHRTDHRIRRLRRGGRHLDRNGPQLEQQAGDGGHQDRFVGQGDRADLDGGRCHRAGDDGPRQCRGRRQSRSRHDLDDGAEPVQPARSATCRNW